MPQIACLFGPTKAGAVPSLNSMSSLWVASSPATEAPLLLATGEAHHQLTSHSSA